MYCVIFLRMLCIYTVFTSLIMMCRGMVLWVYSVVCWNFWVCRFIPFTKFVKFGYYFCLFVHSCINLFLFSFETLMLWMLIIMLPHRFLRTCLFVFSHFLHWKMSKPVLCMWHSGAVWDFSSGLCTRSILKAFAMLLCVYSTHLQLVSQPEPLSVISQI